MCVRLGHQDVARRVRHVIEWEEEVPAPVCSSSAPSARADLFVRVGSNKDEPRRYRLVFHKRHRQLMLNSYLPCIVQRWREIIAKNRQRQLFTNHTINGKSVWSKVPYNPPATFHMLAMDHIKKVEVLDDLRAFREGKDYYSKKVDTDVGI
ncbi:hypothetical protein E2562_022411 [Oryza meyeriana var. granulata]|uniref:Uncharacterized protein n=1 Tax=Oryza meyeriana var. granulata TaxID=110450 RepID=A0A6G1BP33_9ORYZ|nr:hypothetical protein E2562_022411 [Oryza meyeriana var. granulata]